VQRQRESADTCEDFLLDQRPEYSSAATVYVVSCGAWAGFHRKRTPTRLCERAPGLKAHGQ